MTMRPIVGITMGDPVGVGPEVALKALCRKSLFDACRPLVIGDAGLLDRLNRTLGTGLDIRVIEDPEQGRYRAGEVDVIQVSRLLPDQCQPARPCIESGRAMVDYIETAISWAMNGRIHAVTTCPINKAAMQAAGVCFEGHTQLLAARTHTSRVVMMLAGPRLRVALVTTHVPLHQVAQALSQESIITTLRITDYALKRSFGIAQPRIAVAGLNPHAAERGLFGDEEVRVISPAIEAACRSGVRASGPHPPDTVFYWAYQDRWDAVVAMYHDQGLIAFKMVHFTDGVNTTLGLPFVRTSVDHGTAYDIAGQGKADPRSLQAAVLMAAEQARSRAQTR